MLSTLTPLDWLLEVLGNAKEFNEYAEGAKSIATILALFVGGVWTYQRFFQFRTGKPKINLTLEVAFIRRHSSQWIMSIDAILENKSSVRHQFNHFNFHIRYALPADALENRRATDRPSKKGLPAFWNKRKKQLKEWLYKLLGKKRPKAPERSSLSLRFPHTAANGSWLDDAEDKENRSAYGALEPGETDRWTFIACVPADAIVVLVTSELYGKRITSESFQATKVVGVPE